MKKILFSIFAGVILFSSNNNTLFAACTNASDFPGGTLQNFANAKCDAGYTCSYDVYWNGTDVGEYDCGGTGGHCRVASCSILGGYSHIAYADQPRTLTGTLISAATSDYASWYNTPFVYFSNPPQGAISVSLNSKLNSYLPKPSFNKNNGWDLIGDSKKGSVYLDGKEQKHLFYELAMNSITINRNGQNFNSKESITSFLNNSSFFDKLGFSKEQKENSLGYVLQKLNETKDTKYYYLTILDKNSVSDVSELNIKPKPNKIIRSYFAIYPSDVPVKTTGGFVFPKIEKESGFTVKETGELLIPNDMTVFFK